MNMLSVLFCVAVCLATVSAASWSVLGDGNIVAGWTGAFKGPDYAGQKWTFPVTDHGYIQGCVPEPSPTYGNEYYIALNITFQTTAVRKVFGYSQVYSGQDFFKVFVYANAFDYSSPCDNLITRLQGEEYQVNDHILFTAGVKYTIVASSLNDITKFSINILESTATGNTANSAQLPNFYSASGYSECSTNSATSPYYSYEWTQTTTGYFDLTGGYPLNQSDASSGSRSWILANTFLALYNGSVTTELADGDVCIPQLVAVGQSNPVHRDAMIPYQRLIAGNKYTLVSYSQTDNAYGDVGVYVTPASRRIFAGQGFKQPIYRNYENSNDKDMPTGCDPDPELSQSGYFAFNFTALYTNVALVIRLGTDLRNTGEPPIMYLYEGDNTATPPSTCGIKLLRRHDMYYGTFWFNTKPGSVYTIVGAGVKGETFGKAFYTPVYLLTGTQVGSVQASYEGYYEGYIPSTTTTTASASSTSASATSASATSSKSASSTSASATAASATSASATSASATSASATSSKSASTAAATTNTPSPASTSATTVDPIDTSFGARVCISFATLFAVFLALVL